MYVSTDEFEEILRQESADGYWTDPISRRRFHIRSQAYEQFLQDLRIIDENTCEKWHNDKTTDPITNKALDENEYRYKRLSYICKPRSLFQSLSALELQKQPTKRRPGADERRRLKVKQLEREEAHPYYQNLPEQEFDQLKLDYAVRRSYLDQATLSMVIQRSDEIQSFLDKEYLKIISFDDTRAHEHTTLLQRFVNPFVPQQQLIGLH